MIVTALFYAIYTTVRKCFTTEWDEEHKEFWDSAIKGSSPLRAAIRRRFMAEISSTLGRHVIDTYLDLRKFYDLVDAAFLLPEALRLGYDPVVLLMAMQVHLAPRTLRCHGAYSQIITVSNSIIQGCTQSNTFGRIILFQILNDLHYAIPNVLLGEHVDDLRHRTEGCNVEQAIGDSVAATIKLIDDIKAIGLEVAENKCHVVATRPKDAERVVSALAGNGINFTAEISVRDLGVDAGLGNRRFTATMDKRMIKGAVRAKRAGVIHKFTKKKGTMWNTSVLPTIGYGGASFGISPTRIKKLRTIAVHSSGVYHNGGCVTTALRLLGITHKDPAIFARVDQLKQWFQFVDETHAIARGNADGTNTKKAVQFAKRSDIFRAWGKLKNHLSCGSRWHRVHGPMAATIATLSDLGWNPVSPYTWKQPRGSPRNSGFEPDGFIEWNYVGGDTSSVHEAFTEDIENQLWKTAATHRHGRGLERGGDLTAGVKHIEWYRKKRVYSPSSIADNRPLWSRLEHITDQGKQT